MNKLKCDICNGNLVVQSGGNIAICESCGIQYSAARLRER